MHVYVYLSASYISAAEISRSSLWCFLCRQIWSLPAYAMQYSFKGEHSKNSLFRSMASGVTHLYVDEQIRLFSCGADGSLKLRQLPKKDSNVVQLAPY